jgi:hypothetical protein
MMMLPIVHSTQGEGLSSTIRRVKMFMLVCRRYYLVDFLTVRWDDWDHSAPKLTFSTSFYVMR